MNMKEARYYTKDCGEKGTVQCYLCPRKCIIKDGSIGFCNVRQNKDGRLYSLVYGMPSAVQVDPIEKKPLFHFMPGTSIFSIGTMGCNLRCLHCQNWHLSHAKPEETLFIEPEKIVGMALESNCKSIAYTYNEPTIFLEYVIDTARIARKRGLKNVMVSNGFVSLGEPLDDIVKWIDAINVDLKGFTSRFYGKVTASFLQPVLDTLIFLHNNKDKIWLEITNLVIPTLNDSPEEVMAMCRWISKNLGNDVPLHFSAFHPEFRLSHLPPTKLSTLENAHSAAKQEGLGYVYLGNVVTGKENTFCPRCSRLLIERAGYSARIVGLKNGRCRYCTEPIAGVW